MSEVGRLTGVFLDPKKAFADIAARPRWYVPMILSIVASLAFMFCYSSRVGWEREMRQNLESNARMQQMDAEQRERIVQQQVKFAPIAGYVFSVVGVPVMWLIIAGVMVLMVKMGGGSLRFKQMFAITSYSMMPGFLAALLTIVVIFLKNPEDFSLKNPLAFNVAAFLEPPPTTGKFVYSLAKSFDLFSIWMILLVAIGISVATRKIAFSKAIVLVVTPWLIWVLVSSASAGLFS